VFLGGAIILFQGCNSSKGGSNPTAGASGSGGITSTGGAVATGGTHSSGGATSAGGVTGTGGVTSAGGVTVTGGVTSTGGALSGVTFPWQVFDGSVPDVPTATAPGKTWYCDPINGNDAWDGTSFAPVSGSQGPKKSLSGALAIVSLKAGDTILLGGGIYREQPDFSSVSGKAGSPITIGSYGRGSGAPIIDGGVKPGAWTKYTAQGQTTVWQTSTAGLSRIISPQSGDASSPVLGIYVNGKQGESALREVIHGQVSDYGDGLPANQTQVDIKDHSNHWYYDATAKILYADFGGSLGTDDPNVADISILYRSHDFGPDGAQTLIYLGQGSDYLSFIGLTIRAGSWDGVYSEAIGGTFDHCDVKFNGGGGIDFGAGDSNKIIYSRIWMNVLDNWPRFNNGNTGGGWPGATFWYNQSNALAQGNVVYENGGEALIFWGTDPASHVSVNNAARNNVIYDNFSAGMYVDNTQNALFEQNYVFQHPRDPSQTFDNLFTVSSGYNTDWGRRITPPCLGLGDEPGSAADGKAHLSNITVINNIFAGGKRGFLDTPDGDNMGHGLKNCLVANNTWVISEPAVPGVDVPYGWQHFFEGTGPDASTNSFFENNIIAVSTTGDRFVVASLAGAGPGITNDYNLYSGPGQWTSVETNQDFAAWRSAHSGWDKNSIQVDAMLVDATEFNQTAAQKPVYDWSKAALLAGSPALGAGLTQSQFSTDFTGATRTNGICDIGAISGH
jgi:hypothetical protein